MRDGVGYFLYPTGHFGAIEVIFLTILPLTHVIVDFLTVGIGVGEFLSVGVDVGVGVTVGVGEGVGVGVG